MIIDGFSKKFPVLEYFFKEKRRMCVIGCENYGFENKAQLLVLLAPNRIPFLNAKTMHKCKIV